VCGIAGHATRFGTVPNRAAVEAATAALAHRGPDGRGVVHLSQISIGHRRLSIVDLEGSAQPWTSPDGRYTLAFNGEIYNYVELRSELEALGERFRSNGDTEVLLACFIREGIECLSRLNGMFAFAVWDEHERRLTLARDRVGKKPLYYGEWGEGIAFASELDALTSFGGLTGDVDPAAVNDFFSYQYIPFERSIYRNVRKLLPGHFLTFMEGKIATHQYWSAPHPTASAPDDAAEQLRELVADAVRLRLRSDVPVGAFLSGGLDSAIVVASLKRLGASLESFAIGFDGESFDERKNARLTAQHFGVSHHDAVFHLDLAVAPHLARRFGEPFADVSALPEWLLCKHARKAVTVALSGDGSDELFGGYRRYLAGHWLDRYRHVPAPLRRSLKALVDRLPDPEGYFGFSRLKQLKLFLIFADNSEIAPNDCLPQVFNRHERKALLNQDSVRADEHDIVGRLSIGDLDAVERMLQADLAAYLAEDILTKVDRVSMDHALEVRSPFLDHRLVEFACRLPLSSKIRGTCQKWLLKSAFADSLPGHVLDGPKRGFSVPIGRMLKQEFRVEFEQHVFVPQLDEYLNRGETQRLWAEHRSGLRDHGLKLWTIFAFAAWHAYSRAARPCAPGTIPDMRA